MDKVEDENGEYCLPRHRYRSKSFDIGSVSWFDSIITTSVDILHFDIAQLVLRHHCLVLEKHSLGMDKVEDENGEYCLPRHRNRSKSFDIVSLSWFDSILTTSVDIPHFDIAQVVLRHHCLA